MIYYVREYTLGVIQVQDPTEYIKSQSLHRTTVEITDYLCATYTIREEKRKQPRTWPLSQYLLSVT